MAVHTVEHRLSTRGDADIIDLTGALAVVVDKSGVAELTFKGRHA